LTQLGTRASSSKSWNMCTSRQTWKPCSTILPTWSMERGIARMYWHKGTLLWRRFRKSNFAFYLSSCEVFGGGRCHMRLHSHLGSPYLPRRTSQHQLTPPHQQQTRLHSFFHPNTTRTRAPRPQTARIRSHPSRPAPSQRAKHGHPGYDQCAALCGRV